MTYSINVLIFNFIFLFIYLFIYLKKKVYI